MANKLIIKNGSQTELDGMATPLSDCELGVVKDGTNRKLVIGNGTSTPVEVTTEEYILPIASDEELGGVKIGTTMSINESGTANLDVSLMPESFTNEELDALLT